MARATTTSRSSATASTRSRRTTGKTSSRRRRTPGSASSARPSEAPSRAASPGCRRRAAHGAAAAPAQPHEGELARDRASPGVPRLHRREAVRRDGEVVGERRFLGLYTHTAYSATPVGDPGLRRKVAARDRALRAAAGRPRLQGARRHPRDVPARRAASRSRRTTSSRSRWASSTSASGVACACSCGATPSAASSRASSTCRATATTRTTASASRRSSSEALHGETGRLRHAGHRVRRSRGCTTCSTSTRRHSASTTSPRSRHSSPRRPASGPTICVTRWSSSSARSEARDLSRGYADAFPAAYRTTSRRARQSPTSSGSSGSTRRATSSLSLYVPLASRRRRPRVQAAALGPAARCSRTCCRCSRTWASRSPTSGRTRSSRRDAAPVWIYDFGLDYEPDVELRRRPDPRRASRSVRRASGAARSRTTASTGSCSRRRLHVARDRAAARDREVPAAGGHDVQPGVHGGDARRPSRRSRACSSSSSSCGFDPRARRGPRADARSSRSEIEAGARRRREPRRGPDPAQLPDASIQRDAAHELLPARRATASRSRTSRSSSTRRGSPTCRRRGRCSRSSSTRRAIEGVHLRGGHGRARRHPLVGPAARTSAPRCSG